MGERGKTGGKWGTMRGNGRGGGMEENGTKRRQINAQGLSLVVCTCHWGNPCAARYF